MAANLPAISIAQERTVLRAFRDVIQSIKDQATVSEIVRLLETGNVDGVIGLLQLDQATFEPMEESIRQSYREGGITGAEQIGRIPTKAGTLVMRFNTRSPQAEQWLSRMSSRLVTEIVDDQRSMVRERLTAALAEGRNPRSSALDLVGRIDRRTRKRVGGNIGLTSKQAGWVSNAREDLETLNPNYLARQLRDKRFDSAFKKALADGKPMDQTRIDRAITQYQSRAERYRGQVIARTESINALRSGQHESIVQAIETGEVDQRDAYHEWDSSGDSRTRPEHAAAEGQRVPFNQPFIVAGEPLRYPGDPNGSAANVIQCRCRERTVIDFAGKQKRLEGFR